MDSSPKLREPIREMLNTHYHLFYGKPIDLSKVVTDVELKIKSNAKPIQKRGKNFTLKELEFLNKEVDRLLKLNVISPSHSLYDSLPTVARKTNGDYRFTLNLI